MLKKSIDTGFVYFSTKVTRISFIMSIFVVFIHANNLAYYGLENDTSSIAYWVEQIITSGIGGMAVPFFFMMSGYWLFRFDLGKDNISKILSTKLKKKIFTLVIPYLLWNSFGMIFYMFVPRIPGFTMMITGGAVEPTLHNILCGVFLHAYYFTFWYLRDLILLTLLTPLFVIILKNRKISIVILVIFSLVEIMGIDTVIFHAKSSLFFYFSGCFITTFFREKFEKRRINIVSLVSLLIFISFIFIRLMDIHIISTIIYLISPVFLWCAFDLLHNMEKFNITNTPSWFEKQSFFIYAVHIIPVTVVGKVFLIIGNGNSSSFWIIGSFLLTPLVTLVIIYFFAKFLEKHRGIFYKFICGNRG